MKARYLDEVQRVKEARAAAKPTGLAAFLGKVTGVSFVIGKIHKHQDAQRHAAFLGEKAALVERQADEKTVAGASPWFAGDGLCPRGAGTDPGRST